MSLPRALWQGERNNLNDDGKSTIVKIQERWGKGKFITQYFPLMFVRERIEGFINFCLCLEAGEKSRCCVWFQNFLKIFSNMKFSIVVHEIRTRIYYFLL